MRFADEYTIKTLGTPSLILMDRAGLALAREAENRARATVYFVEPLNEEQKSALIEKLEKVSGKTVDARYVEDKSLIGGIKVVLDDKVLDGSISGKLSKIKGVIGK